MKERCGNCRFFAMTIRENQQPNDMANRPPYRSRFDCLRHPTPAPVFDGHWCGEYKPAGPARGPVPVFGLAAIVFFVFAALIGLGVLK